MNDFPVVIEDMTAEWLAHALGGTVDCFTAEAVGAGQIGTCYRLTIDGDRVPRSLIAKLPVLDPAARELLAGAYLGEVRFYRDLAATVTVRVPACYHADSAEKGRFVLLLEDVAPARPGDQLVGCTIPQAHDAVVNLAGLHGPRWCDPALLDVAGLSLNGPDDAALMAEFYAPTSETFLDQIGPGCAPRTATPCAGSPRWWSPGRSPGLTASPWCTATTGWTTCSSHRMGPRAPWPSTGRP
jgi:hypothetical protein